MIPQPEESTAAGRLPGTCCSVTGCCRVPGGRKAGPTYSVPHRWRANENAYLCILRYTMAYYGMPGKSGETGKQVCCVGLFFIEAAGISPLGKEPYRIQPYHRWKVADELWKNLQAV